MELPLPEIVCGQWIWRSGPAWSGKLRVLSAWTPALCSPLNGVTVFDAAGCGCVVRPVEPQAQVVHLHGIEGRVLGIVREGRLVEYLGSRLLPWRHGEGLDAEAPDERAVGVPRAERSTFVGFDIHEPSIEAARMAAAQAGVSQRARFDVASAKDFPGRLVHLTDAGREAAQRRQAILNEQDGEVTLIDVGLSRYRDTLEPALPVFDRRLRNPGLPVRQA